MRIRVPEEHPFLREVLEVANWLEPPAPEDSCAQEHSANARATASVESAASSDARNAMGKGSPLPSLPSLPSSSDGENDGSIEGSEDSSNEDEESY